MDNTITLKELITLKESNKFLDMKEELLGKVITNLNNSTYSGKARIVDINNNEITLMTTSSIGEGRWNDRDKVIDNFSNGFNTDIKSCFIPSFDQINGGWSYMTSNDRRALGFWYWTNTLYPDDTDCVWLVDYDGYFYYDYVDNSIDYLAGFSI